MSSIIVRSAVPADAAQIHRFIVELAQYEKAEHLVESTARDIERSLFGTDSTAHAIIGEKDGQAAGMGVYFFNYSTWLGKNGLYLEDLYVSPDHRGFGIGKKIMASLAAIALEKDCERMEWNVLDWNQPAIDVYDALGALPQNEWIGYRLTGDALQRLAAS